jgi:Polyketide cyclase / dehydrase and lipid transport
MSCCSTGLAVSKIIHVNAPAQTLWDVLTDIEAYPNFVETIKSAQIKLPSKSASYETSSSTAAVKTRVQVGTNIYEERCKKRHKSNETMRILKMRRIVTNVIESPSTNEYSISFSSQFHDDYPRFSDLLCNTSTLSVIPSNTTENSTGIGNDNNCCKLVGSLALEVGGGGSTSVSALCPIWSMAFCKRKIVTHAERHFEEELRDYGNEAERRYQQTKIVLSEK